MPRRSPRFVSATQRKGTVEEGDAGTGAQIKKSAMRQSSHSFSAANEDSLGQDVWIKETRPNNCWPEPEPNLNLTFAERGLWYDGDTVGFRTLEELVEKRKARRIPTYEELVNKILAARRKSYEELLSMVRSFPNPTYVGRDDDNLDDIELPFVMAGNVAVGAASDVVEAGGVLACDATPAGATVDALLDLGGSPIINGADVPDQACLGMLANIAGAENTASLLSSLGDRNEEGQPVVDKSGQSISPHLYQLSLPSHFCCIMNDYLHSSGLMSLFEHCISTSSRSFLTDATFCRSRWHVKRRPFIGGDSDMFWVSPSNLKLHNEVLNYLGSAGIDAVLRCIDSFDTSVVRHWTIFQFSFIVVSQSNKTQFHVDFHEDLDGVAWHVVIPLVLCPSSPPELFVKSTVDGSIVPIKYEIGTALIWGALLDHSTGIFSYESGFRVCLSVSVGSINCGNVKRFLSDISQQFPPRKADFLLDWAKSPHFSLGKCYVPSLQHEALLGKEWLQQYNTYVKIHECNRDLMFPPSIKKWVSHQRYCFAVKHNTISKDAYDFTSSHVRSASRTLTCFREFMLRKINFPFHVERDSGINQTKWYRMYNEVREFVANHGHCKVTRSSCSHKLYSWVRTQKAKLCSGAQLSAVKRERLRLMQELGFFKQANV
jgi:hypothetical protein